MKVTRLKRGYRIRLSDTEFEALSALVEHGQADLCGEDLTQHPLSTRVVTCIESGTFSAMDAMSVDEDRRHDPQDGRFFRAVPLDGDRR